MFSRCSPSTFCSLTFDARARGQQQHVSHSWKTILHGVPPTRYIFTINVPTTYAYRNLRHHRRRVAQQNYHAQPDTACNYCVSCSGGGGILCLPLCPPKCGYESTLPLSRPARTNVLMLPTRLRPQNNCEPAEGRQKNKSGPTFPFLSFGHHPPKNKNSKQIDIFRSLVKPFLLTSIDQQHVETIRQTARALLPYKSSFWSQRGQPRVFYSIPSIAWWLYS